MTELCFPFVSNLSESIQDIIKTPLKTLWKRPKYLLWPLTVSEILSSVVSDRPEHPAIQSIELKDERNDDGAVLYFYNIGITYDFQFILPRSSRQITKAQCLHWIRHFQEVQPELYVQHDDLQSNLLITFHEKPLQRLASFPAYYDDVGVAGICMFGLSNAHNTMMQNFLDYWLSLDDGNQVWRVIVSLTNTYSESDPSQSWSSEAILEYNAEQTTYLRDLTRIFGTSDDQLTMGSNGIWEVMDDHGLRGGRKTRKQKTKKKSQFRTRSKSNRGTR